MHATSSQPAQAFLKLRYQAGFLDGLRSAVSGLPVSVLFLSRVGPGVPREALRALKVRDRC